MVGRPKGKFAPPVKCKVGVYIHISMLCFYRAIIPLKQNYNKRKIYKWYNISSLVHSIWTASIFQSELKNPNSKSGKSMMKKSEQSSPFDNFLAAHTKSRLLQTHRKDLFSHFHYGMPSQTIKVAVNCVLMHVIHCVRKKVTLDIVQ